MIHTQPFTWSTFIPTLLYTVLKKIIVVFCIRYLIYLSILQSLHCSWFRQFFRLLPAKENLFHRSVIGRTKSVISIITAIHQIPHIENNIIRNVRTIQIGKSKAMCKLMADGT